MYLSGSPVVTVAAAVEGRVQCTSVEWARHEEGRPQLTVGKRTPAHASQADTPRGRPQRHEARLSDCDKRVFPVSRPLLASSCMWGHSSPQGSLRRT